MVIMMEEEEDIPTRLDAAGGASRLGRHPQMKVSRHVAKALVS